MAAASIGPRVASHERENEADDEDEEEDQEENGDASAGVVIPDRATIDAIRAKRQQLQQPRQPAPDYISLDGGGLLSSRAPAGGSSDEEDTDPQGRVAMFSRKSSASHSKRGTFDGIDDRASVSKSTPRSANGNYSHVIGNGNESEEDEEDRMWEEEQLRKAVGRKVDEAAAAHRASNGVLPSGPTIQHQQSDYSGIPYHQQTFSTIPVMASNSFGTRGTEFLSIAQQGEAATQALQDSIKKLKETHKATQSSLMRTDAQLSETLSDISTLENSMQDIDKKYIYMQELREYISVMCDFLNDKNFYIEELEEQMQKLHEKRALAVSERRAADLADESTEVEAAVRAAHAVLRKGSSSSHVSAATTAAQAATAAIRESLNSSPELDEFGRDVNLQKRMEYKRREEGRKRRRNQSESKRMSSLGKGGMTEHVEGEVSTDESDSERDSYLSSRHDLLQTADHIFDDALEQYSNLKIVKDRFEGWKHHYPSAYRDAYVSLSVPAVFAPYVRLELLKWNPLYDTTDFFDMEWHKLLFDYGVLDKDNVDPDDADANLIPVIVEKVALPILHHDVEQCWDIWSTKRTKNAVFATKMVISYVPGSSKPLLELLAVVRSRLMEAIVGLSLPAWGPTVMKAVPGASQYAAYRFGFSVRLLRNICLWKNILSQSVLEKLALDELLRGKILPHVKSISSNIHDAITRTERIVASLSGVWSGPGIKAESAQKLQDLVDFIAELGHKLDRRQTSGFIEEETRSLARRLKNMLVALNEYDKARAVLRTFQLKEAL